MAVHAVFVIRATGAAVSCGDGGRPGALAVGHAAAVVGLDEAGQLAPDVVAGDDIALLRAEVRHRGRGAAVDAAQELVVEAHVRAGPTARAARDRLADRGRAADDGRARVARRADRVGLREVAEDRGRGHARVDARRRSAEIEIAVAHDPSQQRVADVVDGVVEVDDERPPAISEARVDSGPAGADLDRGVDALARPARLATGIRGERHLGPAQVVGVDAPLDPAPTADHGGGASRRRHPWIVSLEVDRQRTRSVELRRERQDGRIVREGGRVEGRVDRDRRDVQSMPAGIVELRLPDEDVEIRRSDRLPGSRRGVVEHAVRCGDDVKMLSRIVADGASAELPRERAGPIVADERYLIVQRARCRRVAVGDDLLSAHDRARRRAAR